MFVDYYNWEIHDLNGEKKKIHQGEDGHFYIIRKKLIDGKILKFKVTLEEVYERDLGFSRDDAYRAVYGRSKENNVEHEYHYPNIEQNPYHIQNNFQQNEQMSDAERQQMSDAERQQMSDAERQEKNNINVESKNAQPQEKVENIVENNPAGSEDRLNYPMQQYHYNIQNQEAKAGIQQKKTEHQYEKVITKEKFNNIGKLGKFRKPRQMTKIRMPVMPGKKGNDNNLLRQLSFFKQFFDRGQRINQMIDYINAINNVNNYRKSQKIKSCAQYYVKLGKQSSAQYYVQLGKQKKPLPIKFVSKNNLVM